MELTSDTEKITEDPFAADIFASPSDREKLSPETAESVQNVSENANRNLWSARLPQIRQSEITWDELQLNFLQILAGDLQHQLAFALARMLNLSDERSVEFSLTGKREANRREDFSPKNVWWLTAATGDAEIFFEIGDAFAVWLVDTALDEQNDFGSVISRPLTVTETAVIEYFALNLAREANRFLRSPQIRYRALSRELPAALQKISGSENFSLLVYELQTAKNLPPDIIKIYLTPEALKSFSPNADLTADTRRKIIQSLPEQVKNIRARFVCGSAELTFGELAALETGDVVLFDSQGFFPRKTNFSGRAEILLGDGESQKIIGELNFFEHPHSTFFEESGAPANDKISVRRVNFNNSLIVGIKSFAEFEISRFGKIMAETNDNLIDENVAGEATADGEQGNGLAVENLVVSMRVELEARRLPLSEIGGLRENQTLELNVRPTDEVNILVNERSVGRGELVLIEGERLGVRITKLMR